LIASAICLAWAFLILISCVIRVGRGSFDSPRIVQVNDLLDGLKLIGVGADGQNRVCLRSTTNRGGMALDCLRDSPSRELLIHFPLPGSKNRATGRSVFCFCSNTCLRFSATAYAEVFLCCMRKTLSRWQWGAISAISFLASSAAARVLRRNVQPALRIADRSSTGAEERVSRCETGCTFHRAGIDGRSQACWAAESRAARRFLSGAGESSSFARGPIQADWEPPSATAPASDAAVSEFLPATASRELALPFAGRGRAQRFPQFGSRERTSSKFGIVDPQQQAVVLHVGHHAEAGRISSSLELSRAGLSACCRRRPHDQVDGAGHVVGLDRLRPITRKFRVCRQSCRPAVESSRGRQRRMGHDRAALLIDLQARTRVEVPHVLQAI